MFNSISENYCISANHPSLAGHFSGNPIVAGVIILDKVSQLLQQWQPQYVLQTISQAKFHHPLLPKQPFTIHLIEKKPHQIHFTCSYNDQKIASGILKTKEKQ